MRQVRAALIRALSLVRRTRADQDLSDELQAHLDLHVADNLQAGMSPAAARRAALLRLGGIAQTREEHRNRRRIPIIDHLSRDLRFACRQLARTPSFSLAAALTLTLCIGANAALFSVVYNVLLRPLPIPESDRIVLMSNRYPKAPGAGGDTAQTSGITDYYDRLQATTTFEEQALFVPNVVSVDLSGVPTRTLIMDVTPSFFRLLRVPPHLGRTFLEEERELGHERQAVLSYALWQSLFGGETGVIGRTLHLDGQPYTVVGVMPQDFSFTSNTVALWRPFAFTAEQKSDAGRHSDGKTNIGRLKPGATIELAQAQIDALNAANFERFPEWQQLLTSTGFHTVVERLQDRLVSDVRPLLYLLWGGALFVLLIGCLNISNLILVQAAARRAELATRLALGAGHWRIAGQLICETLTLTMTSAAAGLGLAYVTLQSFLALDFPGLPRRWEVQLSPAVIGCTLAGAAIIGVAMGIIPLFTALPADLNTALRAHGRGNTSAGRRFRRVFAMGQVAFAFVLLLGAGLLLTSFRRVLAVDPGFGADGVLTATVSLPGGARYPDGVTIRGFVDRTLEGIRTLPGVSAAGATNVLPLGGNVPNRAIIAEAHPVQPGESFVSPISAVVTPGLFDAMSARLTSGRFFDERDTSGGPLAMIVDETLARQLWPGQDPVGQRAYIPNDITDLQVTQRTVFRTVVGVISSMRIRDLAREDAGGVFYLPLAQQPSFGLVTFVVRTAGRPAALASTIRRAITRQDPQLPVFNLRTMQESVDRSLVTRRTAMTLSIAFGAIALLLSAIGVYGVLAYLVALRTKEIGIRVALGSSTGAVCRLILSEGVLLVGTGLTLGGLGAVALRRSLEGQLFGVTATDPAVAAATLLTLALVAAAACLLPALRASRIEPVTALRAD